MAINYNPYSYDKNEEDLMYYNPYLDRQLAEEDYRPPLEKGGAPILNRIAQ